MHRRRVSQVFSRVGIPSIFSLLVTPTVLGGKAMKWCGRNIKIVENNISLFNLLEPFYTTNHTIVLEDINLELILCLL